MMHKKLLFTCFSVLLLHILYSQVYFTSNLHVNIGEINLDECEFETLTEGIGFGDITLHPNGKFYGLASVNDSCGLVEIDIRNNRYSDTLFIVSPTCTSLTCSKDGIFYMGHEGLYSFDIETETATFHGNLPPNVFLFGDLIFYDKMLIGGVYEAPLAPGAGRIYQINVSNPSLSEPLLEFSEVNVWLGGLAVIKDDCSNHLLIGSHFNSVFVTPDTSFISSLDPISNSHNIWCQRIQPDEIYGMASPDELRTNCELRLDLDTDNSSGRFIDHFETDLNCTTHFPIADHDISTRTSGLFIDSMVVEVHIGLEGEILTGQQQFGLNLLGNNSTKLVYHNSGAAAEGDFISAIQQVRFVLPNIPAPEGEREVRVRLYANGVPSDDARAFIQVNSEMPSAGQDVLVELCVGVNPNLQAHLGEEAAANGRWEPELESGTGFFNLSEDESGIYRYIVEEGECSDTAVVEVILLPQPELDLMTDENDEILLCAGDSIVWDISVPNPLWYLWSTGSNQPVQVITTSGFYYAELKDNNGCYAEAGATVVLSPDSSITITEQYSLCSGEVWEWEGQFFERDTTLCQTFPRANGCDSTHCQMLTFEPTYQHTEHLSLCEENQYEWQGMFLEQDTLICITFIDGNGCDSTECLDLQFLEDYQTLESHVFVCGEPTYTVAGVTFSQDTSFCLPYIAENGCDSLRCIETSIIPPEPFEETAAICEDEFYFWETAGQILTEEGEHTVTISGENDCDSTFILDLSVHSNYFIQLDTSIQEGDSIVVGNQSFFESGVYNIDWQSEWGCDSTIQLTLDVITAINKVSVTDHLYYVPAVIEPNANTWNSHFTVYSTQKVNAVLQKMAIYDIWGRLIFVAENLPLGVPELGWNGQHNGVFLPSGLYFYQVEILQERNELKKISGTVILVK